jgi:hypothetical protein
MLLAREIIKETRSLKLILFFQGMLLAGQGSKGLGFGTMLGTVNSFPDTAAGGIAGLFLALDSLSSVVAILAYDNIFDDNDGRLKEKMREMKRNSN